MGGRGSELDGSVPAVESAPVDETSRGIGGFLLRRWRTLSFFLTSLGFVGFYLTTGRRVRRRYREAQRSGGTIWLDQGPFANDADGPSS